MKQLTASLVLGILLSITAFAGIEELEKRLEEIVIPEFKVESVTLAAAVDELRALSKEHDKSGLHESVLGVRFAVERHVRGRDVHLLSIEMRDATVGQLAGEIAKLSGTTLGISESGVFFSRVSVLAPDPDALLTRDYTVPVNVTAMRGAVHDDPFGDSVPDEVLREVLEANGVDFPDGASVEYDRRNGRFVLRNTLANHQMVEALVQDICAGLPNRVRIRVELYSLAKSTALGFVRDHSRGRSDAEVLKAIEALRTEGAATLVGMPSIITRSGQRAKIEAGGSIRVVSDYGFEDGVDIPSFETIPLGTSFEVDPVVGADNVTVELNLALSVQRGEPEIRERTVVLPGSGKETTIDMHRIPRASLTTAVTLLTGHTSFLGMVELVGIGEEESVLVGFVHASVELAAYDPVNPE